MLQAVTLRHRKVSAPIRESWQASDTAECIGNDWRHGPERRPQRGCRAIVLRVLPGYAGEELGWALELLGYAGLWDATAFRKIVLTSEPERAEERQQENTSKRHEFSSLKTEPKKAHKKGRVLVHLSGQC